MAGFDVLPLFGLGHAQRAAVRVAVMADLVAGGEDPLDGLRITLGRPAGDEERRGHAQLLEQPENPRHADERPVPLMAHRARVLGVLTSLGEDRRLGVHVEGEDGERRTRPEPGHRRHSRTCLSQIKALLRVPGTELCQFCANRSTAGSSEAAG